MKKKAISAAAKEELKKLKDKPDSEVDFSEIPLLDANNPKWQSAVAGKFFRPIKQPIALRLDSDVLAWFREQGPGYQSRINDILREVMQHDSGKSS